MSNAGLEINSENQASEGLSKILQADPAKMLIEVDIEINQLAQFLKDHANQTGDTAPLQSWEGKVMGLWKQVVAESRDLADKMSSIYLKYVDTLKDISDQIQTLDDIKAAIKKLDDLRKASPTKIDDSTSQKFEEQIDYVFMFRKQFSGQFTQLEPKFKEMCDSLKVLSAAWRGFDNESYMVATYLDNLAYFPTTLYYFKKHIKDAVDLIIPLSDILKRYAN